MDNLKKYALLFGSFLIIASAYMLCQNFIKPSPTDNKISEMMRPNDEFWIKRTFPNRFPDENAYFNGFKQAKQSSQTRGNIPGFDKNWAKEGPGNIGARVNAVSIDPSNPDIILIGYSTGGIWKTSNGGIDWHPVFDDQLELAIGSITFDPNNTSVVYAGTGDGNIPGGVFTGNGIFKSIDGGETWTYLGLQECKIISKIIVHPSNSNILFAATMGNPFQRNNQRGMYKSIDGGKTWTQTLFVNNQTGITDLVMEPNNPNVLYAASYSRIRTYAESLTWSYDNKVYKSSDGGNTWLVVKGGLPDSNPHSRIALAVCQAEPSVVFVQYVGTDLQLENIYKSSDNGANWTVFPTYDSGLEDGIMGGFGWYFGKLGVDPLNSDHVYILGIDLFNTLDGGQTWNMTTPPWWSYNVHADKHDIVFLPNGGILLGTDGGLYKTNDFVDWEKIENNTTSQFYRVAYNPHQPDQYFGGMQDNGTAGGNASVVNDWVRIYGGDGFQPRFNPNDKDNYYFETQGAGIVGTENDGVDLYDVMADDNGVDPYERRNWDTPYFISQHNTNNLYVGLQKVYKSYDRGHNWFPISDDLTGDFIYLYNTHTITSVDESPLDSNIVYTGTGIGNLWKTIDGGITWDSIHQNGLPKRYLTSVKASPYNKNVLFVTFNGYKFNELLSYVFRSTDQGSTWEDITGDLPGVGVNDILILEEEKDKELYIATDGGVFGTIDSGVHWERVGKNMPIIPVLDIEYNPVLKRIIAGTYARSIMSYPIEGITANNELAQTKLRLGLYPNPGSKVLHWNVGDANNAAKNIKVFDQNGKLMIEESSQAGQGVLNINDLPSGAYVITIQQRGKQESKKFVKI